MRVNNSLSNLGLVASLLMLVTVAVRAHTDGDQTSVPAELTPAEQAVSDVVQAYARAYQATDIDAIHELVSAGAFSYFEGAGADEDWADYAAHLGAEMPAFSETRYNIFGIRPEVAGQMAFATFGWKLDVVILSEQFEGGRHPVSMQGLGTAVLVDEGGAWRLRHIHTARKQN